MVNIYRQDEQYLETRSQIDSIQKGYGIVNIYRQSGWRLETRPQTLDRLYIERVQHSEYIYRQGGWCLVTRDQTLDPRKILYRMGVVQIKYIERVNSAQSLEIRPQILDGFYIERVWRGEYIINRVNGALKTRPQTDSILKGYGVVNIY